jgi:hypothetical protein
VGSDEERSGTRSDAAGWGAQRTSAPGLVPFEIGGSSEIEDWERAAHGWRPACWRPHAYAADEALADLGEHGREPRPVDRFR